MAASIQQGKFRLISINYHRCCFAFKLQEWPLSSAPVYLSASIFIYNACVCQSDGWAGTLKVAVTDRASLCIEYAVWPERRHRLQFHSSLCLPPRMKPYRIMSTLRLLLPQHRRLACHNTLTQAGRDISREGESAGSVKATLFVAALSRGPNSSHLQPLKQRWLHNTHQIIRLTICAF